MKCNRINFFLERTTIPSTPPQQTKQNTSIRPAHCNSLLSSYNYCKASIKACSKTLQRIVENLISNRHGIVNRLIVGTLTSMYIVYSNGLKDNTETIDPCAYFFV